VLNNTWNVYPRNSWHTLVMIFNFRGLVK
jgi:hypothetical protein